MSGSNARSARRRLMRRVVAGTAGIWLAPASSGANTSDTTVHLGQSTALTGPLAAPAAAFNEAANAYFNHVNRSAGVHGRRIALHTLDDAYDPARTSKNVQSLIQDTKVLALFGVFGVPNTAVSLPLAAEGKVPLLFPMNGDAAIRRAPSRYLFTATASFEDEIDRLVEHLYTLGLRQIAVAHLSNPFGKALRAAAQQAATRRGMMLSAVEAFDLDGTGLSRAAAAITAASPAAVLLGAVAGSAVAFVRALRAAGSGAQVLTFSGVGADILFKELGAQSRGIVVSQTVPFPWSPAIPIVREYLSLAPAGGLARPSHLGLWGHISARLVVEGLRRAGRDLSSERLIDALESLKSYDLGQYIVDFAPGRHHGSRFVDITMIGQDGRLVK